MFNDYIVAERDVMTEVTILIALQRQDNFMSKVVEKQHEGFEIWQHIVYNRWNTS